MTATLASQPIGMAWGYDNIPNLSGKNFVVTGGNTGIGYATVEALAAHGGHVILACRNRDKGMTALERIKSQQPGADVVLGELDLGNLSSIRQFADSVAGQSTRVDALINNAGVMMPPSGRTVDGFETQFGTNVLGPFALTGLLLPLLAPNARVVTLSSVAHWLAKMTFGNLNAERGYRRFPAYAKSKLACLIFAQELQRRLAKSLSSVSSIAAHPGVTRSDLARHSSFVRAIQPYVTQSTEDGALPSLMAATASEIKGGDFVGPGGFLTLHGAPRRQQCSAAARDPTLGAELWNVAQRLTGVAYL